MQRANQRMLMLLPLLPTAPGEASPYATRSAFGFNPLFIHLGWLPEGVRHTDEEKRRIDSARASKVVQYDDVFAVKRAALERAFTAFEDQGVTARSRELERFCEASRDWLDNYALFESLSQHQNQRPWWEWPAALASRQPEALAVARQDHRRAIRFQQWLQWVCETQWAEVRKQAHARGIQLWGDEPFIIGQDSADCWCWPTLLRRDARLGVPPDEFSADGQDWGLPVFDFEALEATGDAWLKARAARAAATYDTRRIDHAIGYFRQYIRDEQTPRGRFVPSEEPAQQARGERNFKLLSANATIVAEDLGVIPRFVRDTLAKLGLAGYQVMRWSREDGIYRDPRHYPEVSLVTTGTHDTESLRTWWETCEHWEREAVCRVWPTMHGFWPPPTTFSPEVHEGLLRAALESQSRWCLLPWQDVLGESDRTNTPGTVGPHNWSYRLRWDVEELPNVAQATNVADWLGRLTRSAHRA